MRHDPAREQAWESLLTEARRERDAAVAQRDALADALRTLEDLTYGCWDEGPPGEGWPSNELLEAHRKAREVLAAQEGDAMRRYIEQGGEIE